MSQLVKRSVRYSVSAQWLLAASPAYGAYFMKFRASALASGLLWVKAEPNRFFAVAATATNADIVDAPRALADVKLQSDLRTRLEL